MSRLVGRSVCWLAGLSVRIIIIILRVLIDTMTKNVSHSTRKHFAILSLLILVMQGHVISNANYLLR